LRGGPQKKRPANIALPIHKNTENPTADQAVKIWVVEEKKMSGHRKIRSGMNDNLCVPVHCMTIKAQNVTKRTVAIAAVRAMNE